MNLIIEGLFCMPRMFCQFIFLAGEWVHFFRIFCQLVLVSSLSDLNQNSPLGCLCSPVFISWLEQTLQQESYLVPEIFIWDAEQNKILRMSIVQTRIHKYYLKLKTGSAFACYSVGIGRSSVQKPPESLTSRQLASSLISAPKSWSWASELEYMTGQNWCNNP
jgi:hypothetical protein